jgi:predicted metalloprotease with PDZ domain
MKKNLFSVVLAFFATYFSIYAQSDNSYRYFLDLSKVQNDRIEITLTPPKIDENEVKFLMPKMVPGTYKVYDFGRFVVEFKAFDAAGNELPVKHENINEWLIEKANTLSKITYKVDDSFDDDAENIVFEPAGTNIEEDKNFVLNTHGFFGYFEGKTMLPFETSIKKPKNLFGATSLKAKERTEEKDVFIAENYHDLADAPMMYNEPDTVVLNVGGAEVLISVFSPSKVVKAKEIESKIKTILEAQKNYLGGTLPVDRYAFIICLFRNYSRSGSYGALEHSYSSFYYLPEMNSEDLAQTIVDVAAHEFFHIVTPLNIHSEEIHFFDFNKPVMSKHLWLYEGATEYFANHVQLHQNLYDVPTFFDKMSEKIINSTRQYKDDLPFTDMSKFVLDKYESQYGNVYEKGALIGLCLDAKLRTLSDGKLGLMDLMLQLSKKYGKKVPFKDEELFDVITQMTYPEIRTFFRKYVEGGDALPYSEIFAPLGVRYDEQTAVEEFTLQNLHIVTDESRMLAKVNILLNDDAANKKTGWKAGDLILQINGQDAALAKLEALVGQLNKLPEGQKITYLVERTVKGKTKKVKLKGKVQKTKTEKQFAFTPLENPTPEQLKLFKAWAYGK